MHFTLPTDPNLIPKHEPGAAGLLDVAFGLLVICHSRPAFAGSEAPAGIQMYSSKHWIPAWRGMTRLSGDVILRTPWYGVYFKMLKKLSMKKISTSSGKKVKYIFVVGGVMSGVGKGITAASIGKILQARGIRGDRHKNRSVREC